MAITWRTVGGSSPGAGAALLNAGTNDIQQSIRSLQDYAAQQQKFQLANQQQLRDRNTQDYLDQVAAIDSAEQLASPEVQAQLDATRLGYGNLIDRAAARSAVSQQLANLQRQETAAAQFQDMTQERAQRGLVEDLYTAARNGDAQEANRLLAENSFLNEGQLAGRIDDIFRGQRQEERQIRQDQRSEAQFNESMAAARENRVLRAEQLRDTRENRQLRRIGGAIDSAVSEADNRIQLLQAANPIGQKSTNIPKDAAVLMDSLTKAGSADPWFQNNDGARTEVFDSLQSMMADGIRIGDQKVPVTPAVLQQAITVIGGNARWRSAKGEIEEYVKNLYSNNPQLAQRVIDTESAVSELRNTQRNLQQQKRKLLSGDFDLDSLSGTLPNSNVPRQQ